MNPRRAQAFTLIELLVVIAIIGIMAALVAPSLSNFRKGDAMASATSQLLGGVARGRQLAISQRTDVYMVFLPPTYDVLWKNLPAGERFTAAATNLADKQMTGYAFVSLRTVGDQPGQNVARYLSEWQSLPEGIFIPPEKFLSPATEVFEISDAVNAFKVFGFTNYPVPFPNANSSDVFMPAIAFDYQGRLKSRRDEYIPLAHGSVSYSRDPQTKLLRPGVTVSATETPPGNSTNGYNVVHVDWLTGRGQLEKKEIQ